MAVLERDVVLMGKEGGRDTMDFPITRLELVEDTAPVKVEPSGEDLVPLIDSTDNGQMKKTTVNALLQSYTETDPTVPAWAKAASKPSYTAAEVGAIPASQADEFAKKSDLSTVYKYKGSVATMAELPTADNAVGDVWNVEATDMNYGWTGSAWDPLGQIFEVEAITNEEIDTIVNA